MIMTVKSNKYIIKYSITRQFRSGPSDCEKIPLIFAGIEKIQNFQKKKFKWKTRFFAIVIN